MSLLLYVKRDVELIFFQLNLVFSHHKNRSVSDLGDVPSIHFLAGVPLFVVAVY